MPVRPDEFYARREDIQLAIMFFLKAHDLAYMTDEIVFELTGYGRHVASERAQAALDVLVRDLRVEVSVFEDGSITTSTTGI